MALESRADWDKRQTELKKQQDLKIEKNADALAGPGVDRNALAAEMHKERMLDPGRRQNVALEGNFAQKLGVVAENDKSPQAEAIRKVFANPEVIRSFIIEPDETAKLLARTYPEYKTNLENAKPFSMVNGKPVINENSFMYQTLKDAKVDHKNVMKNPLAHDVDKLLRGVHGREEDIFKAIGAHIELKRKQEGLDAGHFSGKEKKGLQSDIKSLERRVEHELKEVKNNTTSRIADKDFKFTRAILEAEPVTAATLAAKNPPPSAAPPAPENAPLAPEVVHEVELATFAQSISKATNLQDLRAAESGLSSSMPLEAYGDMKLKIIADGKEEFVTVAQVLRAKEKEFVGDAIKKVDGVIAGSSDIVALRSVEASMGYGLNSADQKLLLESYKQQHDGKSLKEKISEKRQEIFRGAAEGIDANIRDKTSIDDVAALRASRSEVTKDLNEDEKKDFGAIYKLANGRTHDQALNAQIKKLTDVDASERLEKIEKAIGGLGTDMPLLAEAISGVTPEVGTKIAMMYSRKHGESLYEAFKDEMKISKEQRVKYLKELGLQEGNGEENES